MKLAPTLPPRSPRHREERLKLAAGGLQNLALAVFATVLIAPVVNPNLLATPRVAIGAVLCGSVAEGLAFILLRYIPVAEPPKETPHG